jgi:hypothetical protein
VEKTVSGGPSIDLTTLPLTLRWHLGATSALRPTMTVSLFNQVVAHLREEGLVVNEGTRLVLTIRPSKRRAARNVKMTQPAPAISPQPS